MALKKCKECGHEVAASAPTCPSCGVKDPGKKGIQISAGGGCLLVIVIFVLWAMVETVSDTSQTVPSASPTSTVTPRQNRQARWAHRSVNVRAGRGTNHDVVAQLTRGERVEVDSLLDGWFRVHRGGIRVGYVAASVLEGQPLPNFEIVSWNWRKDRNFGTSGAVIWNVEVRNNTQRYVDLLRVDFTTYDAQGRVVDSDFLYVNGLSPGGTRSDKGYATYYGTEERARVNINP